MRCHLSTLKRCFVCAAIATYIPAHRTAEPTPPTEQPHYPLGCVSRSADPDTYLTGDVVTNRRSRRSRLRTTDPRRQPFKRFSRIPSQPLTSLSGWAQNGCRRSITAPGSITCSQGSTGAVRRAVAVCVWLVVSTNPAIATLDSHVRTSRVDALDLISAAMNNQMPLVTDTPSTPGRPIRNEAATMEAQARVQELRQKFDSWCGRMNSAPRI